MSVGKMITRLRTEKGWTQAQLAERLGMHAQHVHRLEKGRYQPRPSTLERLAEALEVSPDVFLASRDQSIPTSITLEDDELAGLMAQVPVLDSDKRHALKTFLKALFAYQQIQKIAR